MLGLRHLITAHHIDKGHWTIFTACSKQTANHSILPTLEPRLTIPHCQSIHAILLFHPRANRIWERPTCTRLESRDKPAPCREMCALRCFASCECADCAVMCSCIWEQSQASVPFVQASHAASWHPATGSLQRCPNSDTQPCGKCQPFSGFHRHTWASNGIQAKATSALSLTCWDKKVKTQMLEQHVNIIHHLSAAASCFYPMDFRALSSTLLTFLMAEGEKRRSKVGDFTFFSHSKKYI